MEVHWLLLCSYWGNHLRAMHTAENAVGAESGNLAGSVDGSEVGAGVGITDGSNRRDEAEGTYANLVEEPTGTFARLRLAGLM